MRHPVLLLLSDGHSRLGATVRLQGHLESHSTQTGAMNIRCGEFWVNAAVILEMGLMRGFLLCGQQMRLPGYGANQAWMLPVSLSFIQIGHAPTGLQFRTAVSPDPYSISRTGFWNEAPAAASTMSPPASRNMS